MFRMYASNSHSYTHFILALGIVREPTVWGFIASEYTEIGLLPTALTSTRTPPGGLACALTTRWNLGIRATAGQGT